MIKLIITNNIKKNKNKSKNNIQKKLNHTQVSKLGKNSRKTFNYINKIKYVNKVSGSEAQHKFVYSQNGVKNLKSILMKIISWKDKSLSE